MNSTTADSRKPPAEARCPACGRDVLLVRKPVYDGFRKTGETIVCSSCGHTFAEAELPKSGKPPRPQVFTEADRTHGTDPFAGDERGRLCRYCVHYTVNPFRQWCGLHRREVEATDTCDRFESRPASVGGEKPRKTEKPLF